MKRMNRRTFEFARGHWVSLALLLVMCKKNDTVKESSRLNRVALTRIDREQFALVPSEGQHPYCIVYSVSERGLIRQLTMPEDDQSLGCPANQPIGGTTYRVPAIDGKTRLFFLMSSTPLKVSSVTRQLLEVKDKSGLNVFDFRLPGAATLDVVTFDPSETQVENRAR
jgi:hypothetical protein